MRLKALVERLLAYGGPATLASGRARGRSLVLAYHNVIPKGESPGADRSLHIPLDLFCRHLDVIERYARVVPLEGLLGGDPSGSTGIRVALTFDDAYRGAVVEGVAELSRRGLPATVFVTPGCLDGHIFWWDRYPDLAGVADGRDLALETYRGRDEEVRAWLEGEVGLEPESVPDHARSASLEELESATRDPGITLGAHTWSHPNLARLDATELERELAAPLQWLGERFPDAVRPFLAFPYGRTSPSVAAASHEAGYEACFRILGGMLPRDLHGEMHSLPRTNVPATLSPPGMRLRMAGLLT